MEEEVMGGGRSKPKAKLVTLRVDTNKQRARPFLHRSFSIFIEEALSTVLYSGGCISLTGATMMDLWSTRLTPCPSMCNVEMNRTAVYLGSDTGQRRSSLDIGGEGGD